MTTIFFTADPHFGHHKVADLRGFDSVDEHDHAIETHWRQRVTEADEVWLLGDLAVSKSSYPSALAKVDALPGAKHLIFGNHDPGFPGHRNAHKHQAACLEVFASIQPFARRRIEGHDVLLSHFPYAGDHTGTDRYAQYRLPDLGKWLLHGHTHSSERIDGRQIHVGLDAWDLAPVSINEVAALIREND